MILPDRIKKRRKELALTLAEVAKLVGVTEATVQRWESGNIKNLRHERISALSKALRTTPAYLMGWAAAPASIESTPVGTFVTIPVIGRVYAGVGGLAQEEPMGYETATDIIHPEKYRYFEVKGDSMMPRIQEGDRALVMIQDDVESGELAVVIVDDEEGLIKQVVKHQNSVVLKSFNPYYPDRIFRGPEMNSVRIWGRVKEVKQKY